MKGCCLAAGLGVVLLAGCASANERAEGGNATEHLRVAIVIVDLKSHRLIRGPRVAQELRDADDLASERAHWYKQPAIVMGSPVRIGDLDEGSVGCFVRRVAQDALEVECCVTLEEKDVCRSDRTVERLKLREGEKCEIALPRDGKPRVLFGFRVVNLENQKR